MKKRFFRTVLVIAAILIVTLAGAPSSYFCKSKSAGSQLVLSFKKLAPMACVEKMFSRACKWPPAVSAISAFDDFRESSICGACKTQPFLSSMVGLFITIVVGALGYIICLIRDDSRFN